MHVDTMVVIGYNVIYEILLLVINLVAFLVSAVKTIMVTYSTLGVIIINLTIEIQPTIY